MNVILAVIFQFLYFYEKKRKVYFTSSFQEMKVSLSTFDENKVSFKAWPLPLLKGSTQFVAYSYIFDLGTVYCDYFIDTGVILEFRIAIQDRVITYEVNISNGYENVRAFVSDANSEKRHVCVDQETRESLSELVREVWVDVI